MEKSPEMSNSLSLNVLFFWHCSLQEKPFVQPSSGAGVPHSTNRFEGFCMDILRALQDKLGFKYEVYLTTKMGSRGKNGSWDGLMGELINGVSFYYAMYSLQAIMVKSLSQIKRYLG